MAKRRRNAHIGGTQIGMFPPSSDWVPPTSLPDLRRVGIVGLDSEEKDEGLSEKRGPGWATKKGHVCGVSAAWHEGESVNSIYVPVAHPDTANFDKDAVKRWLNDHVKAGVRFVMHNAGYDIGWLHADVGMNVPDASQIEDSACAAYMVDENRLAYDLDSLSKAEGLPGKDYELLLKHHVDACFDTVHPQLDIWRTPARYAADYAVRDAVDALLLFERMVPRLEEEGTFDAYRLEMDIVPVVHAMRKRGVRLDLDACDRAYKKFKQQSQDALDEIYRKFNEKVSIENVRRNDWLRWMFDLHHIPYPINPITGNASFEAKWMKGYDHELPKLLVRAKSRDEAAEKFIANYLLGYQVDGRLHASINQYKTEEGSGTRTYRFSYDSPPMQQMPSRDEEMATDVRGCFLPEDGEYWAKCDYSQQEYRLFVHFAEMTAMNTDRLVNLEAVKAAADQYRANPKTDYHQLVADMTGLARKPAKDCNFAKLYGAGGKKFASMIGKSLDEAMKIMNTYDGKFPFAKQMYELSQRRAQRTGKIRLLDGAVCHFDWWEIKHESWRARKLFEEMHPYITDCRFDEALRRTEDPDHPWYQYELVRSRCSKALNSLIQGSAARQTKSAMRDCWRAGHVPLLQVHDELDFSVGSERVLSDIIELMQNTVPLRVPMVCDADVGVNWGDAKHAWSNLPPLRRTRRTATARPARKPAPGKPSTRARQARTR